MKWQWIAAPCLLLLSGLAVMALQRGEIREDYPEAGLLPLNSKEKSEWIFARFRYGAMVSPGSYFGYRRFQRWAADYPKSDHQFVRGVKRLTRVDTREAEQVVDADSDEIFNWPWVFIEDAGWWRINHPQAKRLRDFVDRGGFLLFDDTHGDSEWAVLHNNIRAIYPERQIEDLPDADEIFHILYDLENKIQIQGTRYVWGHWQYGPDSAVPKWRGIRDDKGRIVIAICHNSDVGDAWEWADSAEYPERQTSQAFRLGINYIVYAMTH